MQRNGGCQNGRRGGLTILKALPVVLGILGTLFVKRRTDL